MMLFITFSSLEAAYSGSQVRPVKMLAAFRALGQEIKVLACEQSDIDSRKKEVAKIFKWLKENTPDICYIELPSGPIFNHCDRRLIAGLCKKGVPIAAFYRDAFYRFAPWWNVSGAKKLAVKSLHALDNYYLSRYCDIVYFPSRSMSQMFGFKRKDVLPPACEKKFLRPRQTPRTCIYVGGLSERYGTPTMLYSFELLNRTGVYPLILVCRKDELSEIDPKYLDAPWLKIAHAEGTELEKYYGIADVGVFFGKRDLYMDFAMPVKVFEYLSYGLPVITTNCAEISAFVSRNKVGVTVNDDFRAIVAGIKEFLSKPKSYYACYKNVINTVQNSNLWLDRAEKVVSDLSEIKRRRGK